MEKTKQKALNQVYQEFINTCMGMKEMDGLAMLVDEKIFGYGSAVDEKIQGIEGVKKLLQNQVDQSSGIQITWKVEPFSRFISADENTAVFADDIFMTIQTGNEDVVMYLRLSIVLNYVDKKWKVIHWHGSKPEEVESEKDTWGIENWKQKAEELEKMVAEKTTDLVEKNRELQIEAALERVRARSMAMHRTDELQEAAEVLNKELSGLGLRNINQCGYAIYNEEKNNQILWLTRPDGTSREEFTLPILGDSILYERYQAWKRQDPLFHQKVTKQHFEEHLKIVFPQLKSKVAQDIAQKEMPENPHFYCANFREGYLHIVAEDALNKKEEQILARFSRVFSQTYTRFLDLQKAEAQAREAQIEAALERVRARTMAMFQSDELSDCAELLFSELSKLGASLWTSGFAILENDDSVEGEYRTTDQFGIREEITFIPNRWDPTMEYLYEGWKQGKSYRRCDLGGENIKKHYDNMIALPKSGHVFEEVLDAGQLPVWQQMHAAYFKQGYLLVISLDYYRDSDLLIRFARVFEQTYTRFLDLQKAEAQAREAQIEAALERVRSRSLAMHHTSELQEVINTVQQQLKSLDIPITGGAFIAINDENKAEVNCWGAGGTADYVERVHIPFYDSPIYLGLIKGIKNGPGFFTEEFSHQEKMDFFNHLFKHPPYTAAPPKRKKEMMSREGGYTRSCMVSENTSIFIINHHGRKFTDEENEILGRFGRVFEQAYTRFLDLQKAEAQAREAQIEAGLERVRSKTMAMHNSQDVGNTVASLFDELVALGLEKSARCGIGILDESDTMELWTASKNVSGELVLAIGHLNMTLHALLRGVKKTWSSKKQRFTYQLEGEDMLNYFNILNDHPDYHIFIDVNTLPERIIHNSFYFTDGLIYCFTPNPISEDFASVVKRFAGVFGQTYKRYLDLKKAEAQAREAQIEAALERVRATSMALHKSEELQNVVSVLFEQLKSLDFALDGAAFIATKIENLNGFDFWMEDKVTKPARFRLPYYNAPSINDFYDAWKKRKDFVIKVYGKEKNIWFKYAFEHTDLKIVPKNRKQWILAQSHLTQAFAIQKNSMIGIHAHHAKTLTDNEIDILKRFSIVFEQGYIRFLDLQKAEAQAREAQIENALEKVRSRSLAMHKSDELAELSLELVRQVQALGVETWFCAFNIYDEPNDSIEWGSNGEGTFSQYRTPREGVFLHYYEAGKNGESLLINEIDETQCPAHYEYLCSLPGVGDQLLKMKDAGIPFPEFQIDHVAYMKYGYLIFITYKSVPESHGIFKRFAKVFEQSYTRFLDIKKAEAQAREAQIEAALERVRAKTMAMHNSKDISEAIATIFNELSGLGIVMERCGINIQHKSGPMVLWSTTLSAKEKKVIDVVAGTLDINIHPMIQGVYQAWMDKKDYYSYELAGSEVQKYYEILEKAPDYQFPKIVNYPKRHIINCFFFDEGNIFIYTKSELSDEEKLISQRFTKVFALTYRRFLDLVNAEKRAKEAVKQASLDRVRGEIASMRTSEDLNRITPVIWRELRILEVPFFRCGVFIVDEKLGMVRVYLTSPDGTALAVLNLAIGSTKLIKETTDFWKKNLVYKTHWNKEEFIRWSESMVKIGQVKNIETYQGSSVPPESLHLHFVPFRQGMLYVGDVAPLDDEKIELVKILAESFSIAYSRYEDFTQLEDAKNQIEAALRDLKSTQSQLIHAEKMASLGELTAGIAHEIQNPLNFVNNFSEVSIDLIAELYEEMAGGNEEDVKAITEDIKQNLEKINHHGRRASSIVKGMLEHSRSGNQNREFTDINALADEYLRLAYHGYRAKDKTFKASYSLVADPELPKIQVVQQDIGRVILNLINNAFYTVSRKAARHAERSVASGAAGDGFSQDDYRPEVIVRTKKHKNSIFISVKDNGDGIPNSVINKIFQPFFTTKPTGEGTGLGLSLSYDIITKGHNGTLEVDTTAGVGTEFIIQLPVV